MIQLLERLELWLELIWPSAKVNINPDITSSEFRLAGLSVYGMKTSSLIKVASEAIRQQMSVDRETKMNSGVS